MVLTGRGRAAVYGNVHKVSADVFELSGGANERAGIIVNEVACRRSAVVAVPDNRNRLFVDGELFGRVERAVEHIVAAAHEHCRSGINARVGCRARNCKGIAFRRLSNGGFDGSVVFPRKIGKTSVFALPDYSGYNLGGYFERARA